jgi:hypothetical protein
MLRVLDISYVAGFFDGEGSVGIYKNGQGQGRTLRVQIVQNCCIPVDNMLREWAEEWGASMTVMVNKSRKSQAWNWQISGEKAVIFLQAIRPHLHLKKDQVDLAIDWYVTRPKIQRDSRGRLIPRDVGRVQYDDQVALQLKAMKRVGWRS